MPFNEEEQTSDSSILRVEVDLAAFARDRLTRELVLAVVHGRVYIQSMKGIVDNCRETARYIQETDEVKNYWV